MKVVGRTFVCIVANDLLQRLKLGDYLTFGKNYYIKGSSGGCYVFDSDHRKDTKITKDGLFYYFKPLTELSSNKVGDIKLL